MHVPIARLIRLPALCCLVLCGQLQAAPEEKPFAEKKVVLQISDEDAAKQTLVLNVAGNLARHYGPDQVDVEIVAFGPGLRLLFADNPNAGRIDSLAEGSGVRFSACSNGTQGKRVVFGRSVWYSTQERPIDQSMVRIPNSAWAPISVSNWSGFNRHTSWK